ncbi:MAG: hypothetical protein AAFN27_08665 [Pseudomonadota bacterium]
MIGCIRVPINAFEFDIYGAPDGRIQIGVRDCLGLIHRLGHVVLHRFSNGVIAIAEQDGELAYRSDVTDCICCTDRAPGCAASK